MSGDVDRLTHFLKGHSLHASRLWIEGCVEYFRSQQPGPQFPLCDLQNFAMDQWLLVDLRTMGVGCLPNDLSNRKEIILSGRYAVQVESVRDISTPAYSQLLLVRGVSTENCDATKKASENWEPKPGRVLKLIIYDGIQECVAMEYSLIRDLDRNLTPGTKMLITGPVRCRKGIFLLEQRNVKILGGEVDTMIAVNALENILARTLNLPENPDPYGTQESVPLSSSQPAPTALPPEVSVTHNKRAYKQNMIKNAIQQPPASDFPDDDELNDLQFDEIEIIHQGSRGKSNQVIEEVLLDDEDDDFLLQLPVEELASQAISNAPEPSQVKECKSNVLTNESSVSSTLSSKRSSSCEQKSSYESENSTYKKTKLAIDSTSSPSQNSSVPGQFKITAFFQEPSVATTSQLSKPSKDEVLVKWPSNLSSQEVKLEPFAYLSHLVSSPPKSGIFPIKGFLLTLLSTLEERDGTWHLLAKLTDGSANVDVNFSEEVLDEIIGFSATEMRVMRQRMSGNPAIKERLKQGFQKAKKKLYEMNCMFYLEFGPEKTTPTIVGVEEISLKHFALLKSRSFDYVCSHP